MKKRGSTSKSFHCLDIFMIYSDVSENYKCFSVHDPTCMSSPPKLTGPPTAHISTQHISVVSVDDNVQS